MKLIDELRLLIEELPFDVAMDYTRIGHQYNYKKYYPDWFPKKDRIYLTLDGREIKPLEIPEEIKEYLESLGYKIKNYEKGKVYNPKNPNRELNLGSILAKAEDKSLLKRFNERSKGQMKLRGDEEYLIVISRHPYDIAGMSAGEDRPWNEKSCMRVYVSPEQEARGVSVGAYCSTVEEDIKEGTLIAYLIGINDKNIKKPLGRYLMKPYYNEDTREIYLFRTLRPYGKEVPGFKETIDKWLLDKQGKPKEGEYLLKGNLYADQGDSRRSINDVIEYDELKKKVKDVSRELYNYLLDNYSYLLKRKNIEKTEYFYLDVVSKDGYAIRYISDPSEEVQLAAVKQNGYAIKYILERGITPSEEVQLAAVKQNGLAIQFILNKGITPSEEVQLAAVSKYGLAIQYILEKGITPSEEVQLAAVKQNGLAIQFILNKGITPSEEVQLAAVSKEGNIIIRYILEKGITPSDEVQLAAVTQNVYAISYILDKGITPSEKVQYIAVSKYGYLIRDILNKGIIPSEKVKELARKKGYRI